VTTTRKSPNDARLASFGPKVSFFFFIFVFFYTNECFNIHTGYNLCNTRRGGCWTATTTRKSPNDARRASFGLNVSFFFFFIVFFYINKCLSVYSCYKLLRKVQRRNWDKEYEGRVSRVETQACQMRLVP
jgi:hypothetical protein